MSDTPKKRGRPRNYDPDQALARATEVFWDAGFTGASLDDLSAAMEMNRPSLYAAFGDKAALYRAALRRYRDQNLNAMQRALADAPSLEHGLRVLFGKALDLYLAGDQGARGCLLIGTAATEAVLSSEVRSLLSESLHVFDAALVDRFELATRRGELAKGADPESLAYLTSSVLHTLAVRARAGEPRAALEKIASGALELLCRSMARRSV